MPSRRLEYLDAMGIQLWMRRELSLSASKQTETSGQAGIETETPKISPPLESESLGLAPEFTFSATSSESEAVLSDWAELQAKVAVCQACPLHQTRTQTVFGVGNRQAEWMLIGEAPGQEEDLRGEPFVGRAGQLLNAMLRAIGISREQVYIANVVKCRPPSNRNPSPEEMQRCGYFLEQQINLIKPKLIVAVGSVSAHYLLKTEAAVGTLRNIVHDYHGIPLIVTYHPAYLLRRPMEKQKAWHDLQFICKTAGRSLTFDGKGNQK